MNKKPTKCDHYWFFKHAIWETGRRNEVAIGRCCSKCGKMQAATVSNKDWHAVPKSYVDMRETLEKELKS